jgi:hypothetical protein
MGGGANKFDILDLPYNAKSDVVSCYLVTDQLKDYITKLENKRNGIAPRVYRNGQ